MYQKLFSTSFKKSILIVAALLLVFSIVLVSPSQVVKAATITVTSTSGGTGGPDCTLRDAITAANTDTATGGCPAGSGGDTIVLASGATYTLTEIDNDTYGNNGLPAIESQITIEGNASIFERSSAGGIPNFRLLFVADDGDLTLNDLTIRNGYADFFFWDGFSGGGAGIYIFGTLDANNITVIDNYSEDGGAGGGGIAVDNYGIMTLANSTVSGNSGLAGGGVRVYRDSTATVINSTINENTALGDTAGGIHIGNGSELTLINCTVSNNYNGVGVGIWNSPSSTTTLINSTISHNSPSPSYRGGVANYGEMTLKNTVVADQLSGYDCVGEPVTSLGYNLDSDGSCNLAATGDLSNTNPQLGPLEDNGGSTLTHALLPGSPAIDAGSNPLVPPGVWFDLDGKRRFLDDPLTRDTGQPGRHLPIADMGAYEFGVDLPHWLRRATNVPVPAASPRTFR